LARAAEASEKAGSSLEASTKRMAILPDQAVMFLRSIVIVSSPEIRSRFSTIGCWSARPDRRASEIMARRLPIRGCRPNCVPREARLGLTRLAYPTRASRMRRIVPLPQRGGPMSMNIFCWLVSSVSR